MAGQESLGDAVLYLTVNDEALRRGIDDAKAYIRRELGQEISGAVGDGRRRRGRTGAGGGAGGGAGVDTGGIGPVSTPQARPARPGAGTQRLSSALIGGAFPLLFGQGAGASLGGLLGGAIGGGPLGFALSLVGTTVGQSIDQLVQKLGTLGAALRDPIANVSELANSVSLSSSSLARYSQSLIKVGREAEAAALIQLDTIQSFGDTSDLVKLSKAQDDLSRTSERLQIRLGKLVAGPLAAFLEIVERTLRTGPPPGKDGLPEPTDGPTQREIERDQKFRSDVFKRLGTSLGLPGAGLAAIGFALEPLPSSKQNEDAAKKAAADLNALQEKSENLAKIRLALTEQIGDAERDTLEINALQLKYDLLLAAAGEDKVKQAELELELQEKIAAVKDSQARREEARRRKLLADSNKDVDNTLRLFRATLRLREAQQRAANPPRFGESSSTATVRQVEQNVAGARREIAAARAELAAAQEKLQNARLFGDAQDIDDASVAVEEAAINLETAGVNLKIAMQEGANTILNNVNSAAEQFRDSIRGLRDLRLGNLRFLPAEQRRDLLREQARRAIPEAQRRGVALRGLSDVINFNRFIEQEQGALQTQDDARRNLVDANNSLRNEVVTQTGALSQLTEVMGRLIDKSWAVYVNVPSQNGAASLNMSNQLN